MISELSPESKCHLRLLSNRRIFARSVFVLGLLLICAVNVCAAQTTPNITGEWSLDYTVDGLVIDKEIHRFVQDGSKLSGTGGPKNGFTWSISGTIKGSQITFTDTYNEVRYTATSTGTTDGNTMFGTWTDANHPSNPKNTFLGIRVGNDAGGGNGNIDPVDSSKRKSSSQVLCNRGPDKRDDFVCTATVGSFDGGPPSPSGTVNFSTTAGSFRFGNVCNLRSNPSFGTTSSCSVVLIQPAEGIAAGSVVPATAEYQGDSAYGKSSSELQKSTVAKLPKKPLVCFSDVPDACKGLNALGIPPVISSGKFGFVTTSYFAATNSGKSTSPARLSAVSTLKAPKRKGDIAVSYNFRIKIRNNPVLKSLPEAKPFLRKLKSGIVLGSFKTTVRYGDSKTNMVKLKSDAQKLMAALIQAQVTNFSMLTEVRTRRPGDKKDSVFRNSSIATLLEN